LIACGPTGRARIARECDEVMNPAHAPYVVQTCKIPFLSLATSTITFRSRTLIPYLPGHRIIGNNHHPDANARVTACSFSHSSIELHALL
jgi:hypothetical protein